MVSEEEADKISRQRLIRAFKHAYRDSLFYSRRFRENRIHPEDVTSIKDFQALVPLTERQMFEDEALSFKPLSREIHRRTPRPLFQLQVEPQEETSLFVSLSSRDMRWWCESATRSWRMLGIGKGDFVAICDYGTSPVAFLASSAFATLLRNGVAETLGCIPICNDGLPRHLPRALHIMANFNIGAVFIRHDLFPLLQASLKTSGKSLQDFGVRKLIVTSDERIPAGGEIAPVGPEGVEVFALPRVDMCQFMAADCQFHNGFHVWEDLYFVEVVDDESKEVIEEGEGRLVITNLVTRTTPSIRYASWIKAELEREPCECGRSSLRLKLVPRRRQSQEGGKT